MNFPTAGDLAGQQEQLQRLQRLQRRYLRSRREEDLERLVSLNTDSSLTLHPTVIEDLCHHIFYCIESNPTEISRLGQVFACVAGATPFSAELAVAAAKSADVADDSLISATSIILVSAINDDALIRCASVLLTLVLPKVPHEKFGQLMESVRIVFETRAHAAILQYALLPIVVRALQDLRSFRRESHTLIDTLLVWFEHKFGDFEKCSAEYAESVKEKLIGYLISILKAALCSSTFRTDVQRCMRLALYISDPKTEEQTRELSQVFLQLIRLTCVQPRILSRLLKILPKAMEPSFFQILSALDDAPEPSLWLTASGSSERARGLAWRAYLEQSLRKGKEHGHALLVGELHQNAFSAPVPGVDNTPYIVVDFSDPNKLRGYSVQRGKRQEFNTHPKHQLLANGTVLFSPLQKLSSPPLSYGNPRTWASYPGLQVLRTTVRLSMLPGQTEAAVTIVGRETVSLPRACAEWMRFVNDELDSKSVNVEGLGLGFMNVRLATNCVEWFEEWAEAWAGMERTRLKREHLREKRRAKERGEKEPPPLVITKRMSAQENKAVAALRDAVELFFASISEQNLYEKKNIL